MNKKVIKYLIWIILIATALILMPIKETKAVTVTNNQFKTSKNLFCINYGYPFGEEENFSVQDYDPSYLNYVDTDVLNYIVSEATLTYTSRNSIGNYIPQKAIWKLASNRNDSSANALINKAYAYNAFVDKNPAVPKIEKEGNDKFAVYYTQTTYSGNTYSNLIFVTGTGFNSTYTTEQLNNNSNGYTHKRIYTKSSGATQASVTVNYETSRTANLKIYKAIRKSNPCIVLEDEFRRIGDSVWHIACGSGDIYEACYIMNQSSINSLNSSYGAGTTEVRAMYNDGYTLYKCKNCSNIMAVKDSYYKLYISDEDGRPEYTSVSLRGGRTSVTYYPQNLLYGTGGRTTSSKQQTITFIQPVTLNFNKVDFNNKDVSGATLNIAKVDNVDTLSASSITIGSGSVTVMPNSYNVSESEQKGSFRIKLTETAPTGYKAIPATTLTVHFEDDKVTSITSSNTTYVPVSGSTVTIKNKPQIEKLTLLKVDSQDSNTKLKDATFKITLTNVESVGNYHVGDNLDKEEDSKIIITGIKTASNGELYIEDLVIKDENKDVVITIEETSSVLGYKKINGKITVTLKRNGTSYTTHKTTKDSSVLNTEFSAGDINVTNHEVKLTVKNIPVMNLGGIVWEDTQTGDKVVSGPNGKYNNKEQGMAGIKVELCKADGTLVTKDAYGNNLMTKTSSGGILSYALYKGGTSSITLAKGQYIFPNIEKGDYYIRFTYDGINYKTVDLSDNVRKEISSNYLYEYNLDKDNNHIDVSKTTETQADRDAFNAKFTTISSGKATGSEGDIALIYSDSTQAGATVKTSRLVTKDNNGNVLSNYAMKAKTNTYLKSGDNWKTECWNNDGTIKTNTYAQDINCGLTFREFDLAVGMDIDSAKLTINGKDTTYNYNQIIDSGLTDPNNDLTLDKWLDGNISAETDKLPTYNLYLYTSDYNYRIGDYKTDKVFESGVTNNQDANKIVESQTDKNKELRAFITYKVILKNQTTQTAQVNELAYYYDENYTFVSAKDAKGKTITFANDANLPQINGKTSARVSGFASDLGKDSNYRQELYFTFEVKKDENRFLVKDIECANLVEIISYTTTEGLIDNDSAPGNMGSGARFEDDTDKAKGIKLTIASERETRIITGTVFEDTKTGENQKYNGQKDDSEQGVNDVIVQLIEIKKIGGVYYEYIWQETRSGSNEVKTTSKNGYTVTKYTNNVKAGTPEGNGMYEFQEFIPGNYIIRFIYGDGKTYDITSEEYKNSADNVKKYNGQDYKSTIDPKYQALWYNTAGYTARQSIARDNEARRLEVMSYSTTINGTNGEHLANKTGEALNATWMCAETSRINIPVDEVEYTKTATTDDDTYSTTASYEYTRDGEKVLFGDMNFGLALRPQNNLVLEKHITGLKITPSGTGVQPIVDAKKDIKAYYDDDINNDMPQGVTQGLATIMSTKDERGFWQVATDVEELMQGAQLEVEYTYVLRNDGDTDYLSNTLVEAYEKQDEVTPYKDVLTEIKNTVKSSMKNGTYSYSNNNKIGTYLGQYYYNGEVNNKENNTDDQYDAIVPSRIELLEEALNNDLTFDTSEATSFKKTNTEITQKPVYNVAGEAKTEGIDTVVQNTSVSEFLVPGSKDFSKVITLRKTLATVGNGELGANLPSYIAEILQYSNAAGRIDMNAKVANLSYVHSDDTSMTLNAYVKKDENGNITDIKYEPAEGYTKLNEHDEFWGESIIITKPTGEDKLTPIQIVLVTISAVAAIGVGILLIKKFVLKK